MYQHYRCCWGCSYRVCHVRHVATIPHWFPEVSLVTLSCAMLFTGLSIAARTRWSIHWWEQLPHVHWFMSWLHSPDFIYHEHWPLYEHVRSGVTDFGMCHAWLCCYDILNAFQILAAPQTFIYIAFFFNVGRCEYHVLHRVCHSWNHGANLNPLSVQQLLISDFERSQQHPRYTVWHSDSVLAQYPSAM